MVITQRQQTALAVLGSALLAVALGAGALLYHLWQAWQDMPLDAQERGHTFLAAAGHVWPHAVFELVICLLALSGGLLALSSRRWFAALPERDDAGAARAFALGAWLLRGLVIAGPLAVWWLRVSAVKVYNPAYHTETVYLGLYGFVSVVGLLLVVLPAVILTWAGLGRWQRWAAQVGAAVRGAAPPSGTIQNSFRRVRELLTLGMMLLGLITLCALPFTLFDFRSSLSILDIQTLIAVQLRWTVGLLAATTVLAALLLAVWRAVGNQISYVTDVSPHQVHRHAGRRETSAEALPDATG